MSTQFLNWSIFSIRPHPNQSKSFIDIILSPISEIPSNSQIVVHHYILKRHLHPNLKSDPFHSIFSLKLPKKKKIPPCLPACARKRKCSVDLWLTQKKLREEEEKRRGTEGRRRRRRRWGRKRKQQKARQSGES